MEGVSRHSFILWFLKQPGNAIYTYASVDKGIDDCIEDEWIGEMPVLVAPGNPVLGIERIDRPALIVRSRGREMRNWIFFVSAVIEKLSAKEIALYGITTAVSLALAAVGLSNFLH